MTFDVSAGLESQVYRVEDEPLSIELPFLAATVAYGLSRGFSIGLLYRQLSLHHFDKESGDSSMRLIQYETGLPVFYHSDSAYFPDLIFGINYGEHRLRTVQSTSLFHQKFRYVQNLDGHYHGGFLGVFKRFNLTGGVNFFVHGSYSRSILTISKISNEFTGTNVYDSNRDTSSEASKIDKDGIGLSLGIGYQFP